MFGSWSRPECVEELHQQAQLNLQSLLQGKDGRTDVKRKKRRRGENGRVDGWCRSVCFGCVCVLCFEWVGEALKQGRMAECLLR